MVGFSGVFRGVETDSGWAHLSVDLPSDRLGFPIDRVRMPLVDVETVATGKQVRIRLSAIIIIVDALPIKVGFRIRLSARREFPIDLILRVGHCDRRAHDPIRGFMAHDDGEAAVVHVARAAETGTALSFSLLG